MAEQASETQTRTFLQPIAAPSILGLYGFAGATLILASHTAKWWGDAESTQFIWQFTMMFGGVAQFIAGMWAYKARDGIATAMHGMWGSFWIGLGILELLFATGTLTQPQGAFPALGMWFVVLAWITLMGAIAAQWVSWVLAGVLHTLWLASAIIAVGEFIGSDAWRMVAGWVFVLSAVLAWYMASALMFEGVAGRAILPALLTQKEEQAPAVAPGTGEPGVKHGQ